MRLILLYLISLSVFAAAPFQPHVEKRFKPLENERQTRSIFSFTSTLASGATQVIGSLPKGSVLVSTKMYIQEQFISGTNNTISTGCESDTDLAPAMDLTEQASGTLLVPINAESASGSSAVMENGCDILVTIGAGASGVLSGKFIFFVNYILDKI